MLQFALTVGFLLNLLQTPEPGARHELLLRLRYPDGRPAVGVTVSLLKLPDRTPLGWQNADSACRTDEQGQCVWQLFGGLYEFSFPEGFEPDPITLTELGEGGLNNLSVYLDRDFTMGMVLADTETQEAGETLFFDLAPEEPLPQFRVPASRDARQHHLAPTVVSDVVLVDQGLEPPSGEVSIVTPAAEENNAPEGSRLALLFLLIGLAGLVAIALALYRAVLTIHDTASVHHQVADPDSNGEEEDLPWA